jgi:hypothetical protein
MLQLGIQRRILGTCDLRNLMLQYLIPCEVPNQKNSSQLDAALSFARFSMPSASSNTDCPGYTSNLV